MLVQNKAIQCVPVSAFSSRFITSFILLAKLSLEKPTLNLGSFVNIFEFQSLSKDEEESEICFDP